MSYNGWSNRETWLVNVWFNPESRDDVLSAQSYLEEQYNDIPDGPLKDMIDLSAIDWEELLEHFSEEEDNESLESFYVDLIEEGQIEIILFECMAEDKEHAKEQAENAYPHCTIVSIL